MKPTQQDLIRLARLAGFHVGDQFIAGASEDDLERFAAMLLERFGAGGGEPVMVVEVEGGCWNTTKSLNFFGIPDGTYSLYTHPSPTDLKAEYERGLEDALSAAVDAVAFTGGAVDTEAHVRFAIEALKGKQ